MHIARWSISGIVPKKIVDFRVTGCFGRPYSAFRFRLAAQAHENDIFASLRGLSMRVATSATLMPALQIGGLDRRTVRFDPDVNLVVDHAFDGDQQFHVHQPLAPPRRPCASAWRHQAPNYC